MEFEYVKLMEENNLKVEDLPKTAKTAIKNINNILKGVKSQEKKGIPMKQDTIDNLEAQDELAYNVILDMLSDRQDAAEEEEEEEETPAQTASVAAKKPDVVDAKVDDGQVTDPKGIKIDADLKAAFESGKKTITLEELKSISKTAYDVVFENYDDTGDNGISTTNFDLIESDTEIFTLTQK